MITTITDVDGATVTTIEGTRVEVMTMVAIMTMGMTERDTVIMTVTKGSITLNKVRDWRDQAD